MNDMWKFGIRMLILGLLVCFGIFYGVDLATNGLSETGSRSVGASHTTRVDPLSQDAGSHLDQSETVQPEHHSNTGSYPYQPPYDTLTAAQSPTLISVLADVTGDVLQRTARGGIELIVSLFDGILH